MKKIILFVLLSVVSFECFGQAIQTVLGIETHTTMKNFKDALAKKGYKPTQTVAGKYEYVVQYAGYQNCTLVVAYNNGNDSITYIDVRIPHESYSKDQDIFKNLAEQLKVKYGDEREFNITSRVNFYGERNKGTLCMLILHHNESSSEDGVVIEYTTKVKVQKEVVVSDDI